MSGYYPPGVTGGEDAIAGPAREAAEHRDCGAGTLWIPVYQFEQALDAFRRYSDHAEAAALGRATPGRPTDELRRWGEELRGGQLTQVVECEWSGLVDVAYWRQAGTVTWQCPRCGHEHEEQADDG